MDENHVYNFGVFLDHSEAQVPTKANPSDAGFDLYSVEDAIIDPGSRKMVDTGIILEMPNGWEAQIRPRSGHAGKLGLSIVNTPGTVDCSFVGNIRVILYNTSNVTISLPKGSKIAQMVFQKIPTVVLNLLNEKPTNDSRGTKGFGSSGI
jgi:dUTP pyrophosphatase